MDQEQPTLKIVQGSGMNETLERALFEIKRVIAGQDAMLERVLVCLLAGGPPADRGRPGPRQDADGQDDAPASSAARFSRVQFTPDLVPVGSRRHADLPARARAVRRRARPGLLQLPARGRDQPRAGEGAVGAARGDAGAPGDDRRQDVRRPGALPSDGDAEPDRVGGHLPASGGAGRPLHAQGARRLPGPRRGADRRRARALRARSTYGRCSPSTSCAALQRATRDVYVDPVVGPLRRAAGDRNPRSAAAIGREDLRPYIAFGASPRGPINLVLGARALAVLRGRDYALPQDVQELAKDVLRHRLVLTYQALAEEVSADAILDSVLEAVELPRIDLSREETRVSSRARSRRSGRPLGPAPARCPDALLRALDLTVRRRIEGLLAGEHRAATLGHGTELAQVRPYEPGDDVRQIEWNVTARTGEPHVRVQVAERALTTWLLLDTSPSMAFGTADRRKVDVAEGVALAVGHVASRRGNRLGVVTFGDREPRTLPPRQGSAGLLRSPARPAARAGGRCGRRDVGGRGARPRGEDRSPAFAARSSSPTSADRATGGRHCSSSPAVTRCSAIEVRDPREQELPNVGELWLVDPETGRQLRVDTSRRKLRDRFAAAAEAERRSLAARARVARRRPRGALDCRRLAARARRFPRSGGEAPVTFEWPLRSGRCCSSRSPSPATCSCSGGACATPRGSPTSTCSRTSSSALPAGAATCRRHSRLPRSQRSSSGSRGRRP